MWTVKAQYCLCMIALFLSTFLAGCSNSTNEEPKMSEPEPIQIANPDTDSQQDPILGIWNWGWDGVPEGQEPIYQNNMTFHADDTMSEPGGQTGKWNRAGKVITISWANGATDTVTMSDDGKNLDS